MIWRDKDYWLGGLDENGKEIMFWIAKAAITEIHLFRAIFSCIREQFIHITFLSLTFLVSRYRQGGISNIKMRNSITELYVYVYMRERKRRNKKSDGRYISIYHIYINIWWCIYCWLEVEWIIWHSTDKLLQPDLKHIIPFTLIPPSACSQSHMCCHKNMPNTPVPPSLLFLFTLPRMLFIVLSPGWFWSLYKTSIYVTVCRKFSSAILLSLQKVFLLLMVFPLDCQMCVYHSELEFILQFCIVNFLLFSLLVICGIDSGSITGYSRRSRQMDIWARWGWLGSRMWI